MISYLSFGVVFSVYCALCVRDYRDLKFINKLIYIFIYSAVVFVWPVFIIAAILAKLLNKLI